MTYTITYRILYRMKVTANIPDQLITEVKHFSNGKNITESLIIALNEWVNLKHVYELNKKVKFKPLEFKETFSAAQMRELNRRK